MRAQTDQGLAVELDCAAAWSAAVEADYGVGEIGSGGAVPSSELDDFNLITGDGVELSAEVTREPACLQFQFTGCVLGREEGAFMDACGRA